MKPSVAFWVEKDAIVCLVSASMTSPLNMMAMPSCELRNPLVAEGAEAALLFPEREQGPFSLQGTDRLPVEPFLEVGLPGGIVRMRFAPNCGVPFEGDTCRLHQMDWLQVPPTPYNFS